MEGHPQGSRAHKLRFVLTALAVIIGVAFMAGTSVLTATIQQTFDDLFANIYRGTDAVVRARGVEERLRRGSASERPGLARRRRAAHPVGRRRRGQRRRPVRAGGRQARQGDRRQRTRPPSGSAGTRTRSSTSSTSSTAARRRAADEIVIDRHTADDGQVQGRRPRDRAHEQAAAEVHDRGHRAVRDRRQPGGRVDHAVHDARGATHRELDRPVRRDQRGRQVGREPGSRSRATSPRPSRRPGSRRSTR